VTRDRPIASVRPLVRPASPAADWAVRVRVSELASLGVPYCSKRSSGFHVETGCEPTEATPQECIFVFFDGTDTTSLLPPRRRLGEDYPRASTLMKST
jgi:hypothetical protein